MARIEHDDLQDAEQIFLARSLRMALRVEEQLMMAGVDYAVEVESFGRSLLFGAERMGAAFYVASGQAEYCRRHLTAAGLGRDVVE